MKLQGRVLCFACVGKSPVKCLLSEAFRGLVERMRIPFLFDTNRRNYSFLDKQTVYQSLFSVPLTFGNVSFSGKSSVYQHVSASHL